MFDWLLIDSAPLLPLADAEIISRVCDGTMVVVRCDKSPKNALRQALERVAPAKMIGLLLNDFAPFDSYGYSECLIGQRANSPEPSIQGHRLWNRTIDAQKRVLRFCSIQFSRLARRGA